MKVLKNKQVWQILGIIVIIAAAIVLLFVPKLIDHRYSYSYDNIKSQNERIVSINNSLISNESHIQSLIYDLETTELELETLNEDVFQIRKGIKESYFKIHIPSILISLEQTAQKNKLELTIDYNSMKTTASQTSPELPPVNENPTEPGPGGNQGDTNITVTEEEEAKEENKAEGKNDTVPSQPTPEPPPNTMVPSIEGIDITTIPIKVSGTYYNVRNYIKYLDEIGMIEPSSVVLTSEGRNISASVTLNVFHGEEEN